MNIDTTIGRMISLGSNVINSAEALDEMRWRIDLRAPLANMTKTSEKNPDPIDVGTLIVPVNRLACFIRESWPSFLCGQSFLNFPERQSFLKAGDGKSHC